MPQPAVGSTKTPRAWFRIALAEAQEGEPATADIYVFDLIGDWIDDYFGLGGVTTAKTFLDELSKLPESVKTLRVHVNSPGGDVFSAVTIANMLRAQSTEKGRTVEMSIEGLAASAASIITCAGDVIRIADNALVMIHNPWSWAIGEATDMRKTADELDKVRDQIVATYRWVSDLSEDELGSLMNATTWMDAEEALANGFATEIVSGMKAAAALRPEAIAKLDVPEAYRARVAALVAHEAPAPAPAPPAGPTPMPALEVVRSCTAAGFPELADILLSATATPEIVQVRLANATQVRALCRDAGLGVLANGYVAAAVPVDIVRGHLTTVRALRDGVEIDGHLRPDAEAGRTPVRGLNANEIYAERNKLMKGAGS